METAAARRAHEAGQPRVSVALCTRNGARYLREQLDSVLAQTVPVAEIVLGDDGSSDETVAIARTVVGDRVPLVVREHAPALGVARNFGDAIAATSGDVVALCDQDDRWRPDRLELLLPWLSEADLVCSDARLVDADGRPLGTLLADAVAMSPSERGALQGGDAFTALARRSLVTGATAIIDGDLARRSLPIGEGWIHDEWLALAAAMGKGVRWLPEPLVDYRQHGANVLGARRLSLPERLASLLGGDAAARRREATRAASLAAAASERGLGTPEQRAALAERAAFHAARAALPVPRFARAAAIVRLSRTKGYARHSSGIAMALRDLLGGA